MARRRGGCLGESLPAARRRAAAAIGSTCRRPWRRSDLDHRDVVVLDLVAEALVRLGHLLAPGEGHPAAVLAGAPRQHQELVSRLLPLATATEVLVQTSSEIEKSAGANMPSAHTVLDGMSPKVEATKVQEHILTECGMQWPPDISSEGCKGQQEPPLGDTASLQNMADAWGRAYYAEQALLLAQEEVVRAATEVQGPTDTSSEECGGQQGPPPAEPLGEAGEQWLHWHRRKRRRQAESAGATQAPLVRTTAVSKEEAESDDAGAQWLLWYAAQRQPGVAEPGGGVPSRSGTCSTGRW